MKILIQTGVLALVMVLAGCASAPRVPSGQSFAVPKTNPLYAVKSHMSPSDVRKVVGEPDDATSYTTGKQWIPFYFGGDTARTDWVYDGNGYVVFSRNRWSGSLKVIKVSSDEHG